MAEKYEEPLTVFIVGEERLQVSAENLLRFYKTEEAERRIINSEAKTQTPTDRQQTQS